MDYVEKRKKGKSRILEKLVKEYDKAEKLATAKGNPIAIHNDMILHSIYHNLTLQEKKLYRYILSLIKKDDDINSTFIIRHTTIREILNTKSKTYTSQFIFNMLHNISASFKFDNGKSYVSMPIFKIIKTSPDNETTNVIFNEFFNEFIFQISDKGHFLKYELAEIIKYKNLHTIEIFELLLCLTRYNQRDEIVSIEYDIETLKKYLNCDKQETKIFIRDVIKKCILEINKYNKRVLGGTIEYKYNKYKKSITFYTENINLMLKK